MTMQRWKHCLSGSVNPSLSSSFSILRINSSASSFCMRVKIKIERKRGREEREIKENKEEMDVRAGDDRKCTTTLYDHRQK